ncbi:patched domain-containing protein 1-like [Centruroides sculpturatus]|uniref:patched domain-containing protein 1-like n=1 Tax=Centruroides sculpturatus TaxID=218467 RepID=UPI000C6D14FE|nr:patched domain-containing protein 1-like [Centruroides sculpturatus]
MKMEHRNIRRIVSTTLSRIGFHVGCYPQIYVAVSFITSLVLATGLLNIPLQKDVEYLYIPSNAKSMIDRAAIESIFPTNMSQCDYRRTTRFEAFATTLVTPGNGTSVLEESIIEDVIKLDEIIQNVTILWNNTFIRYSDLCCKMDGNICHKNFALTLKGKTNDIKKAKYDIKYPVDIFQDTLIMSAVEFGGVTLNEKNMIRDSKAIRLVYALDRTTKEKTQMALKWEQTCLDALSNIKLNNIKISKMFSHSVNNEINRIGESGLPLILIIAPIMLVFSAVSCMSTDSLSSKPWLGIAGCVSPSLATVAAFGLLCYCRIDYTSTNVLILFLISGIGVDDAFILIAAWRRTDVNASVHDRMKNAYAEAAVSITITSLTNFLAFCVGFVTPYKCIQIMCTYSVLAIVFDYIYQLLFFGGLMALDGYREKNKLHSVFCWPINCVHLKLEDRLQVISKQNNKENVFMVFFSNVLGEILGKSISKLIVIILFIIYVGVAVYCMKFIREGDDFSKLYPYSSYATEYLSLEYKYFFNYSHQVQIVINQTLDYSNVTVQDGIEDLLQSFESASFISDSSTTESWLREFLAFTKSPVAKFSLSGYNLSDSEDFLNAFQDIFLKVKVANRFINDVVFNEEGIGVDDAFILIAAWRRTDVNASVHDRMKNAYAEAAVSITITSLTNFLAFCVGFVTPYKCIHIFSAYAALAIVFDYIYQLLFFGGLMALDGYREKNKLHSAFCWPINRTHLKLEKPTTSDIKTE